MTNLKIDNNSWNGYKADHPWYYLLGGAIPTPKQIMAHVINRGYKGYMTQAIQAADNKPEPIRSEALRKIKNNVIGQYRKDMAHYRKLACELRVFRKEKYLIEDQPICNDIHTSISLKYNHLFNDFGHLVWLNELLSQQRDLFGD